MRKCAYILKQRIGPLEKDRLKKSCCYYIKIEKYLQRGLWISPFVIQLIRKYCQCLKKMYCRPIFMHKMSCKSGQEWYINKSHCKNLHIVAENKILKFGVCRCYRSGDYLLGVWGKTHFEKTAFKDFYGKS